jgi:hypothetical protein
MQKRNLHLFFCLLATLVAGPLLANGKITTPTEQFGFEIGVDYQLLTYTQLVDYWKKLEGESDRMKLVEIGTTAEGRTMLMAIITSTENHRNLDRYKEISKRLALAEDLTEAQARELAAEGKAVVWIDGGIHATEVVNSQAEFEIVYQMLSRDDPETMRFLNDVILLTLVTNPDGMELVSNWYMREREPTKRSTRNIPRLYQKYIGHDNNRDSFMANMPETDAMNRILYRESLLSGYKSNKINWIPGSHVSIPGSSSERACKMGVFSKIETLRNC